MSKAFQVGEAFETAINALVLPGATVRVAKIPGIPKGKTPPVVTVSVGEDGQAEDLWAGKIGRKYAVTVTIVSATNNRLTDVSAAEDWLELIGKAFGQTVAVAGFNRVWRGGAVPFDPAGLDKAYDYSSVTFTVEVIEDAT